jgi:outer membrane protein insertion porin family
LSILSHVQRPKELYSIFTDHHPRVSLAKISLGLVLVILSSCGSRKLIPKNELLLTKNVLKGRTYSASSSEMKEQLFLKPNRKLFGFRVYMRSYYFSNGKKGEKPVLIDTNRVEQSAENLEKYLFKKGYYDSKVTYEIKKQKWRYRRGKVVYSVDERKGYRIDSIQLNCEDQNIRNLIESTSKESNLRTGTVLTYEAMSEERGRINTLLKNNGYYYFNPSFVEFQLDTNAQTHKVHVDVRILNPQFGGHKVLTIKGIKVVGVTTEKTGEVFLDTVKNIIYQLNELDISYEVLTNNILLVKEDIYRKKNVDVTYERLLNLGLFQSINIKTLPNEDSTTLLYTIQLEPSPKYDFTWEPQLVMTDQRFNETQSSRNYGFANEVSIRNKNIFKNGEELNLNLRTALETQFDRDADQFLNTFLQEFNLELRIPQLIFLKTSPALERFRSTNTRLSASYLFERNPFYKRNLFPFIFKYEVFEKNYSLYYNPLLISYNQAEYDQSLLDPNSQSYIPSIDRIFTNNLITSQRIGGIYTSKNKGDKYWWQIQANALEVAGLLLPQFTNYGKALSVNHSTFLRSDADIKVHVPVNDRHQFVFRTYIGGSVPLGEESIIPFERRYFAGGANFLRGWRLRSVGPGSFSTAGNLQVARSGEMIVVGNAEYRFTIFDGYFDFAGALFVDAGNVWNIKEDQLIPEGTFRWNTFYSEFAINSGLGLRIDFDFLILRIDRGVPIWDPNFSIDKRLVFREPLQRRAPDENIWILEASVWNIAIGYPF